MTAPEIPDPQEFYKTYKEPVNGTVGHLTSDQEQALKKLWIRLLAHIDANTDQPIKVSCDQIHKTAFMAAELSLSDSGAVNKWYEANHNIASDIKTQTVRNKLYLNGERELVVPPDFKPLFQDNVDIRYFGHVFWQACMLNKTPDSYLLTFLRAALWNIDQAFDKIVCSVNWRATQAIDTLMWAGELDLNNKMMESGMTIQSGVDRFANPVFIVRVRQNNSRERSEGDAERYTAYILESIANFAHKHKERALLIYDYTNFKLENAETVFIRAIISTVEKMYPQIFNAVINYVDSWIFSGIWRLMKGLMNPSSAKRTFIVKNAKTLETYINSSQMIEEIGGAVPYEYKYVYPSKEENAKMFDSVGRKKSEDIFLQAIDSFIQETKMWISEKVAADGRYMAASRMDAAREFDDAAHLLDQYVRARSIFERTAK
ncbi:CRAL-TRIO domain-containing protein [Coemansia spiralis]|nr:CRAL-TRIO domain-containing protein [Coemansia spiralis]